jgi:hypothetical protein
MRPRQFIAGFGSAAAAVHGACAATDEADCHLDRLGSVGQRRSNLSKHFARDWRSRTYRSPVHLGDVSGHDEVPPALDDVKT